jgi:hypothetical protein
MRLIVTIAAPSFAAVAASAQTPSTTQVQPAAVNYGLDRNWLCLPGRKDVCSTPLPTTALNANGYGSTGLSSVAANPPVDCFYVYPTISTDPGLNSDISTGPEEAAVVKAQFARFASVCRTFAPIYRQMTVASVIAFTAGADVTPAAEFAYRDVAAAWRNYLATRNRGRPFVLIGHSQGSALLQQLIAREIERDPATLARMKLAIIPGYNLLVPLGRRVGGTFAKVPLCSHPQETGCAVSWTSFRDKNPPPEGAMFGISERPGMTVGCVNPARPGSQAWEPLDSYWYAKSAYPVPGGPIVWSSEGPPPSAFLRTQGLVWGKCINAGPRGYLSVRTNSTPGDKRTSRIGGEVSALGMFVPGWGMHLSDVPEAEGDLIRMVGDLSR